MAVKEYKRSGGKYVGAKSKNNHLSKWTRQRWGYVTRGDERKPRSRRGRYLPEKVRASLTPAEKRATNRQKRKATAQGRGRARYSASVAKKVRQA